MTTRPPGGDGRGAALAAWLDGAADAAAMGGSSPSDPGGRATSLNRQRIPARREKPPPSGGRGPSGDDPHQRNDDDPDDPDEDASSSRGARSSSSALLLSSSSSAGASPPPPPSWTWDDSDVLASYGAVFAVLALGSTDWAADLRLGYVPYFASLAFGCIYVGAHRGLCRDDRENLTLSQTAAAPLALSVSLLGVYVVLRFTAFDLGAIVGGYFWLLGSLAAGSTLSPFVNAAARRLFTRKSDPPPPLFALPVPPGFATDARTGAAATALPVTLADAIAYPVGVACATADLALGHGDYTLNNFLAFSIAADFLSVVGLGSFSAAAALLLGLLAYDAFWVFGSGDLVASVFGGGGGGGEEGANASVMMTVATSSSFQGPFRILFPRFDDVLDPAPPGAFPFSLLGLGDVAAPGLLACLALRYDASRATDMRARAVSAAEAFMGAFDDAWSEADERSVTGVADRLDETVAARAADAAERAFDRTADARDRRRASGGTGASDAVFCSSSDDLDSPPLAAPRAMGGRATFAATMRGYVVGLAVAIAINRVTGTGQPALVYLVPATLGSACWTAMQRDELRRWVGFEETSTRDREKRGRK
jgi:minor histocompatibility antigen H13